jgi:hypothetical protein
MVRRIASALTKPENNQKMTPDPVIRNQEEQNLISGVPLKQRK